MGDASGMKVPILDIRSSPSLGSLADSIRASMNPPPGQPKSLSTLLLYNEKGLKLFEEITYLPEYYLTNGEIDTLHAHAASIVAQLPARSRLLELGSGNLRKVSILLDAFEAAQKDVEYYALDLSLPELERTFSMLDINAYKHVIFKGLHGTYDDALTWLRKHSSGATDGRATCVVSLGSSLGNFALEDATDFLAGYARVLGPADRLLIGVDACQDAERVFRAYNDDKHVTERFYRNGLDNANSLLGYPAFKQEDWTISTAFDTKSNKHFANLVPKMDLVTKDFSVHAGETVYLEESWKFPRERSDQIWRDSGLVHQAAFEQPSGEQEIHLLSPGHFDFKDKPHEYAASPLPTLAEWHQLWAAWDMVTRAMIPREELLNKPIKLRNDLIFYLGHIPAFADIHHHKATSEKFTEPAYFSKMFERGIDPDVDNPEKCHDHSEIPDTWPALEDLQKYQQDVRARFVENVESGRVLGNRRLARGYWLAYEHEAMHLETFLYMLIQSSRILAPPGVPVPDFKKEAKEATLLRTENQWHRIPESTLILGLDDPENNDGPDRYFGWDVERPQQKVNVKAFKAQSRPISNGEYARFLEDTHADHLPASWSVEDVVTNGFMHTDTHSPGPSVAFVDGKSVRTVYGPIPLKYALDWPVMASYDELAAYARWANGRIPTLEEARSMYNFVKANKLAPPEKPGELISAVNGHLSNEGVEEDPPAVASSKAVNGSAPDPQTLFADLTGCNVGFKHWLPTPVTGDGSRLRGQGDTGGLWEWTSTPLAAFEGYKPMDLYPGYSSDFFDGKHNICLGGSWATVPRIAGRRSFVNWYQHNYPYVWCTARLVRDMA